MNAAPLMQPPFDLPPGVTFDGEQDFLGRKLLMFTDTGVTGSTFTLTPKTASPEALAMRLDDLRAGFAKEAA